MYVQLWILVNTERFRCPPTCFVRQQVSCYLTSQFINKAQWDFCLCPGGMGGGRLVLDVVCLAYALTVCPRSREQFWYQNCQKCFAKAQWLLWPFLALPVHLFTIKRCNVTVVSFLFSPVPLKIADSPQWRGMSCHDFSAQCLYLLILKMSVITWTGR